MRSVIINGFAEIVFSVGHGKDATKMFQAPRLNYLSSYVCRNVTRCWVISVHAGGKYTNVFAFRNPLLDPFHHTGNRSTRRPIIFGPRTSPYSQGAVEVYSDPTARGHHRPSSFNRLVCPSFNREKPAKRFMTCIFAMRPKSRKR
jgi:hypothetical protein